MRVPKEAPAPNPISPSEFVSLDAMVSALFPPRMGAGTAISGVKPNAARRPLLEKMAVP
jgi:hypothetical protein